MTQVPTLVFELECPLPRSKRKRIIKKWFRNQRNWITRTRESSAEEEREHEERHRRHSEFPEVGT